jgi:hypothetical protein
MTAREKDVGYKRPPKHTQWKTGQCGNPKRRYKRPPRGAVTLIHQMFAEQINIVENGVSRRVSRFEAIFLQLLAKEVAGSKRATTVRLRYQVFASGPPSPTDFVYEYEYQDWVKPLEKRSENE